MVSIYRLYDPAHPEITKYIGKTIRSDLRIRLREHICHAKKRTYHVSGWVNQLTEKGIKPGIELLDICYDDDWEFWEKFYILKYKSNNLTNIESGGKSSTIRRYTIKGTNKNVKSVDQLDMNFKIIKTFKSIAEAGRQLGVNRHVIAATCRGLQSKAYGFRWKFSTDTDVALKEDPKKKPIIQLDKNNNKIAEYKSIQDASINTGINRSTISNYINGSCKQNNKFIWKLKS